MRIVVTGGRNYEDKLTVHLTLSRLHATAGISELAHGACPTGADSHAASWARGAGIPEQPFHPDWRRLGKKAGPIRNARMLEEFKPDLVVAFPGGRGTTDCLNRAEAMGIKTLEVKVGIE